MSTIHIIGGKKLEGSIFVQGSKNAALPIMAATLLTDGVCILENCPQIADVKEMIEILKELGCILWQEGKRVYIMAPEKLNTHIDKKHITSMRSSVILLGVLLSENGYVSMEYPGGCVIGNRPIDMHIMGLKAMGTRFDENCQVLSASVKQLTGAEIKLGFPSVGATENLILAAVKAKGHTHIYGAAKEPEIVHLCHFLKKCGAKIWGEGTEYIHIEGVLHLKACKYTIPADRIVAGTYLMSALATKGAIQIKNAPVDEMTEVIRVLEQMGAKMEWNTESIKLYPTEHLQGVFVETKVYPGFPTDLQSPMLVLMTQARGKGRVRETIYENRFRIVSELVKMKANLFLEKDEVQVDGASVLQGTTVKAQELRGNAALIMAGLVASGETTVLDCQYVKRGYEDICRDLKSLGAMVYEDEER